MICPLADRTNKSAERGKFIVWITGFLLIGTVVSAHPARIFELHEPDLKSYELETSSSMDSPWITVRKRENSSSSLLFGSQLIVHTKTPIKPSDLAKQFEDRDCTFVRQISPLIQIFETPNALKTLQAAQQMGSSPLIYACYPNRRLPLKRHRSYAAQPNDSFFSEQWYLENRALDTGLSLGTDLNLRAAWPTTRGKNVSIAIVDDGVDADHPDLALAYHGQAHHNFANRSTNGLPRVSFHAHGTAVAGLAAATGNNEIGMSGSAPESGIASWVIFDTDDSIVDSLALSDMFSFLPDQVTIQNHSWGNGLVEQLGPTLIEQLAISNAVYHAREGKGILMIRAGGNGRTESFGHPGSGDANDDGYASFPGVIAVGAVNEQGRAATYSSPGAALLLAAPGGEDDRSLFTTDRPGTLGFNTRFSTDDLASYGFGQSGFVGTSASAPLVSGICALIVAANPILTVRDVQQILLLSCRHHDLSDPDLKTNGAGFSLSHNVGFGVPDSGKAVHLATSWHERPPLVQKVYEIQSGVEIPDDSLFVRVSGQDIPPELQKIPASPGQGPFPDDASPAFPLTSVGRALTSISTDLSNKGALIERGENFFSEKIENAAAAGAALAIIYNNTGGDQRVRMGDTFYVPVPAVLIGQTLGEALVLAAESDNSLRANLEIESAHFSRTVSDTLLVEHVGLRIKTTHSRRGDLRITLKSPAGTISVLQHVNNDNSPGPSDWTYFSTHSFFESSYGEWQVSVTDMAIGNTGDVVNLELIINGTAITDVDADGLDDPWEQEHFGSLSFSQIDDTDQDGNSNMVEQLLRTDPTKSDLQLKLDLSPWNASVLRISWPSTADRMYQLHTFDNLMTPNNFPTTAFEVKGRTFETEFFSRHSETSQNYFRVIELQP